MGRGGEEKGEGGEVLRRVRPSYSLRYNLEFLCSLTQHVWDGIRSRGLRIVAELFLFVDLTKRLRVAREGKWERGGGGGGGIVWF